MTFTKKEVPTRPIRDLLNGKFLPSVGNFVQDMRFSSCQRPFYIYVLTAFPAFVEAALLLRLWEFDDLVRARAEGIADGGGKPRGRKRHIAARVAKPLPRTATPPPYKQGLHWLLRITQPLETIGYGLLLYGAIDGFYADWMMYLDDADACLNPGFYGPLIRRDEDFGAFPNPDGGALALGTLVCDHGNWGSTAFGAGLPIGRYSVVLGVTMRNIAISAQTFSVGVKVVGALNPGDRESGEQLVQPGEERSFVMATDILFASPLGGSVAWVIKGPVIPIGCHIVSADIYIQRREQLFGDPV